MSKQSAVESAPTVGPTSPTPLAQEATKRVEVPDSTAPTAAPTLGLPQDSPITYTRWESTIRVPSGITNDEELRAYILKRGEEATARLADLFVEHFAPHFFPFLNAQTGYDGEEGG